MTPHADLIAQARTMRRKGRSFQQIADKLNWSKSSVRRYTMDVEDPALTQRLKHLRQYGFDVPPSKQADWNALGKAGITAAERKKILNLE